MKHSYLMTTAVIAIAIPLVLGTVGIINPSVAYGQDEEKRIQLNLAESSNTATQTNTCGNLSNVQDDSDVNCANLAAQYNAIGQSNTYTEQSSNTGTTYIGGTDGGGGETNVQVNAARASNTATQTNTCGNLSNVQDDSDVNCANLAFQANEIL